MNIFARTWHEDIMSTDKVTLTPAFSDANLAVLREFRLLLQSTMGPNGSCKIVLSGGGYAQLVCGSGTLLSSLELHNPICRFIGHAASELGNFGLYFGVLVSHLAEQFWAQNAVTKQQLFEVINTLTKFLEEVLGSRLICATVDFRKVAPFVCLVRTVISSKCSSLLCHLDVEQLCVEIVKLFLNCVDEETNTVGKVYVKVESGSNHVSSHDGLLYQITESHDVENIIEIVGEVKVIVFTVKLENQYENSSVLGADKMLQILDQAVKKGVKIVACQMTVSGMIKLYLLRKRVVLLERMGTDLTTMLIHISGAIPVSDFHIDFSDVDKLFGSLSSVSHIQFNGMDYIVLQNKDVPVGTMLIQNDSLVGTDHVKTLVQQAFGALRSLVAHPLLVVGGGCLEIWLIAQLNLLQASQRDKALLAVSRWMQWALLSACGPRPAEHLDSVYHHGWREEEAAECNCGKITMTSLQHVDGFFIPITELMHSLSTVSLQPPQQPKGKEYSPPNASELFDSQKSKEKVIISALETFMCLSDIGLIMYKD